jgi:hypothetical protein
VVFTGHWWFGNFENGYFGSNFVNDGNQSKGNKSVAFNVALPASGSYDVSVWVPADPQNATNVPVDIQTSGGTQTITVDEQTGGWIDLGSFAFGSLGTVVFRTDSTNGLVVANAVKFTPGM